MSEHEPIATPLEEREEEEVDAHVLKEALAAGAASAALFAGQAATAPAQLANPDGGAGAAQNADPGPGAAGGGQNADPGPGAASGGQNRRRVTGSSRCPSLRHGLPLRLSAAQ
jgi:hypothetical protein